MEALILDMLEWIEKQPRTYDDVMAAWRTSCPRLTVWEDAWDRRLVNRERLESGVVAVTVTPAGRKLLSDYRSGRKRLEDTAKGRPMTAHAVT
jgi:hypothetical protein